MVGKLCTVCKNRWIKDRTKSYFSYPHQAERRQQWLIAINRLDLEQTMANSKARKNHRICEIHFEDRFFKPPQNDGRKLLTKDAIPTLHLQESPIPTPTIVPMTVHNVANSPISFSEIPYNNNVFNSSLMDDGTQTPPNCTDLSEFCESILRVSKGTQTSRANGTIKNGHCNQSLESNDNAESKSFLKLCQKFLPDHVTQLIKLQIDKRENRSLNTFGLKVYFSSNYNFLRDMLNLPSVDSLKHFVFPRTTHLNENFLNALRSKVANMSVMERICSFSVGSILLKPSLYYDIKFDRIIGFHDMDGEQMATPAKCAIILMVQGLLKNWKQPIAYTFISDYYNFSEISLWIDEIIILLINIGLDIRAFVSDPRSEILYLSDTRSVTPQKTYFNINGRNIFYIYDPSKLLKMIKIELQSCYFYCDVDNSKNFCDNDFVEKLNKLHSILNSKTSSISPFEGALWNEQYEIDFLRHMLLVFQNLKVLRKVDAVDVTHDMKFVQDFQITIESVLLLFNDLMFIGVRYLKTSRLSHNCLEDFFNKVRESDGKDECTPRRFNKYFVKSFIFNLMKKPGGYLGTSQEDCPKRLTGQIRSRRSDNRLNRPLKIYTTDYRSGLPEKNAFVYVCGYCYFKCLQRHKCDKLKAYLKNGQNKQVDDDVVVLCNISLDFNMKSFKILPPDSFTQFLMLLELKFKEFFKPNIQICSIGHEILQEFKSLLFDMPCPCFPIDYLKTLFVRVRLYYTLRKNNKMFKSKKGGKLFKVFSL